MRAGRTGRAGKTGVATTFINKLVDESLLLDLKHLLIEAKQRVPPVLLALEDPADLHADDGTMGAGCACEWGGGGGGGGPPRGLVPCLAVAHCASPRRLRATPPPPLPARPHPADCGGLGHRITECPKLEHQRKQLAGPKRDIMRGGEW